jgi:hypothetical protein
MDVAEFSKHAVISSFSVIKSNFSSHICHCYYACCFSPFFVCSHAHLITITATGKELHSYVQQTPSSDLAGGA